MQQEEADERYMQEAIKLAKEAERMDEVPVGAVIVLGEKVIGRGFNRPITQQDPSAHAEIAAMQEAAKTIQNYRLIDCTLYTTLEPCLMCAGAMVHARIRRLVFGAYDKKSGCISSRFPALELAFLNHQICYQGGVLAAECGAMISSFFQNKRKVS